MVKRPIVRYHGGKWRLAPWIIGHFPPHRVYVEPFGGGGSVLMRKPRSYAEVYNDTFSDVVNVFKVLRDDESAKRLAMLIYLTPYSRSEFEKSTAALDDPIERAASSIFRAAAGFGSASINKNYSTGFRASSTRSGTTPAMDWENYPDCIASFTDRLRGVFIESRCAIDVMAAHDSEQTLHYVDPPYLHKTRSRENASNQYQDEMSDWEHVCLLIHLMRLKGNVILSGYDNDIYNHILKGWTRIDRNTLADSAAARVESIWINPAAAKHGQQSLFNNVI